MQHIWSKQICCRLSNMFQIIEFLILNLSDKSHIVLENRRLLTALIKCNQANSLEMMKATEVKIIPMYWNEVQNQLITFISAYINRFMIAAWSAFELLIQWNYHYFHYSILRHFQRHFLSISFNTVTTSQILVICDLFQM